MLTARLTTTQVSDVVIRWLACLPHGLCFCGSSVTSCRTDPLLEQRHWAALFWQSHYGPMLLLRSIRNRWWDFFRLRAVSKRWKCTADFLLQTGQFCWQDWIHFLLRYSRPGITLEKLNAREQHRLALEFEVSQNSVVHSADDAILMCVCGRKLHPILHVPGRFSPSMPCVYLCTKTWCLMTLGRASRIGMRTTFVPIS